MASSKRKVGTIRHETSGAEIDYFLSGTRFTAICLEEEVSAPDAATLRHDICDRLDHWVKLEWFPMMEIELERERRWNDNAPKLELSFERFYLSRSPAGRIQRVEWDTDPVHRKANMRQWDKREVTLSKLPLTAPLRVDGETILMDFDEAIWQRLVELEKAIKLLSSEIYKMLSTKAGLARLVNSGAKFLITDKK